ncbi:sensor histidine kinase NtrY-like [Sphingomonas edaphi]|uniref:histidine kinase n=1 Tax=Sphingomonas edaphi TaxID=2315689 RepID=A0A418Q181_9SPHN|nr:ATP-binding protein [Sphingomonas edaphi]RIX31617.1 HAMP domain-containing protein [Sphingomonas edaphi]
MDAQVADSGLIDGRAANWFAREKASGRIYNWATIAVGILLAGTLALSYVVLTREAAPGVMLSPPQIALLLVANLIPSIALMVLLSRKIANARAANRAIGTGQLHTRLVALFSVIAAVPTVIVSIFAALLLQSGLEFWFSDRARGMLENTVALAQSAYDSEVNRVGAEGVTMVEDFYKVLGPKPLENPRFREFLAYQTYQRSLNEAAVISIDASGQLNVVHEINYYEGLIDPSRVAQALTQLKGKTQAAEVLTRGRIAVLAPVGNEPGTYLFVARQVSDDFRQQIERANGVLTDYRTLLERSRTNQLQFNAALLAGALVIVALSIFAALKLADRLLRPVEELVDATGRVEEGDLTARVAVGRPTDEIAMLGTAFNRMTGRLEEQTGALMAANQQLDTRRAFIEAVLSSVTAGVIAVDGEGIVQLTNRSAETLLQHGEEGIEGKDVRTVSPELDEFLSGEAREATVLIHSVEGQRTLAVKRMRYADGSVLTFDDITEQLSDQRRAAWSDIARRIAHEIKNPLTPIQLAAERLQRRYGSEIGSDPETFSRLTDTIVRQVGDLRRMVDEFSNFARMPKPVFRQENVHDIARAALFLHEVAHPGISFSLDPATGPIPLVCDRRQLGQALTNVVKNAVEAIEARRKSGDGNPDGDRIDLAISRDDEQLVLDITDTGIGLPQDRERLTEPYMTTRVRGTGLGLAIVKKIVEEHLGEIAFLDRPGGGTRVRIAFDADRLAALETEGPAALRTKGDDDEYDEEEPS